MFTTFFLLFIFSSMHSVTGKLQFSISKNDVIFVVRIVRKQVGIRLE